MFWWGVRELRFCGKARLEPCIRDRFFAGNTLPWRLRWTTGAVPMTLNLIMRHLAEGGRE